MVVEWSWNDEESHEYDTGIIVVVVVDRQSVVGIGEMSHELAIEDGSIS
jgi:hypothetical protein